MSDVKRKIYGVVDRYGHLLGAHRDPDAAKEQSERGCVNLPQTVVEYREHTAADEARARAVARVVEAARNAVPMMQMAWVQYGVGGMFECMDALRSALSALTPIPPSAAAQPAMPPDGTRWNGKGCGEYWEVVNGVIMFCEGGIRSASVHTWEWLDNHNGPRILPATTTPATPPVKESLTTAQPVESVEEVAGRYFNGTDPLQDVITADRKAVTAPLRAEIERLRSYTDGQDLRSDFKTATDMRSEIERLCRCVQRRDQNIADLTAKIAALESGKGGVDPELLETARGCAPLIVAELMYRRQDDARDNDTVQRASGLVAAFARSLHAALREEGGR